MDKLSALTSFVQAVKLGSFSAAAAQLGVSQPAVSQQVRALEDSIGARLINRTTRRLSLTEPGERYFAYACEIVDRMAEADRAVQSNEAQMSGRLSASLPAGFAEPVLADFLVEFQETYPDILLDVQMSDVIIDLQKERVDVAIRLGDLQDDRLIVKRFGSAQRVLVASRTYLDRVGRPACPDGLQGMDFLLYPSVEAAGRLQLHHVSGETLHVPVSPVMVMNNSATLRHAAQRGLGIATSLRWLADPLLKTGELELVLPDWTCDQHPVHAVYPSNRFIPLKVRRFVTDLQAYMSRKGAFEDIAQIAPAA